MKQKETNRERVKRSVLYKRIMKIERIIYAFTIIFILLILGGVFFVSCEELVSSEFEKLQKVGLSEDSPIEIQNRVYWDDPLEYTSGYEVVVATVDPSMWIAPYNWIRSEVSIDDICAMKNVIILDGAISKLNFENLPSVYHEWYFVETGREAGYNQDWEYCFGLYNTEGILLIYRGHHLYGDSFIR